MATTTSDLVSGARVLLRDFPHYFEIDEGPLNVLTIRLPHPNISATSLQVYIAETTPPAPPTPMPPPTPTTKWTLDERNGLLKLTDESYLVVSGVISAGYSLHVVPDSDLLLPRQSGAGRDELLLEDVELDSYAAGAGRGDRAGRGRARPVVAGRWSCASISTYRRPRACSSRPTSATSRSLEHGADLRGQYSDKAAMLNMGLGRAGGLPPPPGVLHDRALRAGVPGAGDR